MMGHPLFARPGRDPLMPRAKSRHATIVTKAEPYESTPGRWRVLITYKNGNQRSTEGTMQWSTREQAQTYAESIIGQAGST